MRIPAQLVNLLGIVVTAAILIAGVALLALPLYGQSQTTDSEARTVAQTNELYTTQVAALEADAERLPEILAAVDALQNGIPAHPQLDDVHELVNAAAGETGAVVVSVTATGPDPWAPRTQVSAITGEAAPAASAETTQATDAAASASVDPNAASPETGEPAPADPAASADPGTSPQQQVTATITVQVPDAATAAAFLEILRGGPRLIGVDRAVLTDSDDGALELVVTAFAFLRAEN